MKRPEPNRARQRQTVDTRKGKNGVSFRLERVCCGKTSCGTCNGTAGGRGHGPYWYAYWKCDGSTRSAYVGLTLDGAAAFKRLKAHGLQHCRPATHAGGAS